MTLLMYAGILLALGLVFFGWCLCAIAGMDDDAMGLDAVDGDVTPIFDANKDR